MSQQAQDQTLDPTRWRTLFVVAIAQLMIVLDSSIMNIAIPSAKIDLGITDANQQWIITAYTLAFGSLLLLGGRIGDYMGRKKIFLIGLIGFAAVSALGGIASTQELLFAARALSAEAWGDYRYALVHHRRHHPSSPYNKIEVDSIELELRTLDTLSQPLNLDSSNTPDQEEIIKHLKRAPH